MKRARDFRAIARSALSGRWGIAVLAGFIAAILGAASRVNFNFTSSSSTSDAGAIAGEQILGSGEAMGAIAVIFGVIILIALLVAVVYLVIGSIVSVGYSKFNLDLVDREKKPEIATLFAYFKSWKAAIGATLLRGLYVVVGMLLFLIPGIIASYNYAMVSYILAEHPEMTAREALSASKEMMRGNRWRLFCLECSFIGWGILTVLTLGLGNLWLRPYTQTAIAAFYRDISGTEKVIVADLFE